MEGLQVSVDLAEDSVIRVVAPAEILVEDTVVAQEEDQRAIPVDILVRDSGDQAEVVDIREEISVVEEAEEAEEVTLTEVQVLPVPLQAWVGMEVEEALEMVFKAGQPGIRFRKLSLLIFEQVEK